MKVAAFQENIFYKNKQWSILNPQSIVCRSLFYTSQRKTPITHLPQLKEIQHPDTWEKITKLFFEARDSLYVYVYIHIYANLEYTCACIHT